jgi:hypothetical protein
VREEGGWEVDSSWSSPTGDWRLARAPFAATVRSSDGASGASLCALQQPAGEPTSAPALALALLFPLPLRSSYFAGEPNYPSIAEAGQSSLATRYLGR